MNPFDNISNPPRKNFSWLGCVGSTTDPVAQPVLDVSSFASACFFFQRFKLRMADVARGYAGVDTTETSCKGRYLGYVSNVRSFVVASELILACDECKGTAANVTALH